MGFNDFGAALLVKFSTHSCLCCFVLLQRHICCFTGFSVYHTYWINCSVHSSQAFEGKYGFPWEGRRHQGRNRGGVSPLCMPHTHVYAAQRTREANHASRVHWRLIHHARQLHGEKGETSQRTPTLRDRAAHKNCLVNPQHDRILGAPGGKKYSYCAPEAKLSLLGET